MILDGKRAAEVLRQNLISEFANLKEKGIKAKIAIVLPQSDEASLSYLKARRKIAELLGVEIVEVYGQEGYQAEDYIDIVKKLNNDSSIYGIMIDRPFPKGIDEDQIYQVLDYRKDIDGCNPINAGLLLQGKPCLVPSTARAVLELIKFYGISLIGKEVVVVGRSRTVGMPTAQLCIKENATVTVCHSKTNNLAEKSKRADIVIVAMGKKDFFTPEFVTNKTIIVDVGIHYDEFGKMCGDVRKDVYDVVDSYSPVPGGVGPLTNISLMYNLLDAISKQK